MSRVNDFRSRRKKIDSINTQQSNQVLHNLNALMLGLLKRVVDLEKKVKDISPYAKFGDVRSLALSRLLIESGIHVSITDSMLQSKMKEILIEDFEADSADDDRIKNLEVCTGTAKIGCHAIYNLKLFKDGKELEDQEVPRGKVELGKYEQFPELDDALLGMSPGQSKKIKLELMGKTDEGLFTLIGLRKQKSIINTKEGKNETNKTTKNSKSSKDDDNGSSKEI